MARTIPYDVILPVDYDNTNTRYPVLYLLHGLFGRYDNWLTHTNIADYAAAYKIIVVLPEGGDGWYTDSDTVSDDKYETYIVKELIPEIDNSLRTIPDRRARAIAGLSMGGYGSLKFGIKYPSLFAFAGSISGALDPTVRSDENPKFTWNLFKPSIMKVYGESGSKTRTENDLIELTKKLPDSNIPSLPYFYLDCGTEDSWLTSNRQLADFFLERKIPHEFREMPGSHSWAYWDARVQYILSLTNEKLVKGPR